MGEYLVQSLEESVNNLIKLLKEKGYDSNQVLNELLNDVHIKEETPTAT
jgi:hypothetical protein